MNVRLIVCDIDNTLVEKHQPLTPRAKKAIEDLKAKGILFGLASGRGNKQLRLLEKQWDMKCDILIGANGAELYDGIDEKLERLYIMKKEWVQECHERFAHFECDPYVICGDDLYAYDNSSFTSTSFLKNEDKPHIVSKAEEFWEEDAVKTGFRAKEEVIDTMEALANQHPSKDYIGFKTETTMFEFGNAHASKGTLLEYFCKNHNIPIDSVWAFGDMSNDITLLEAAGVGVCMCNGSDDCKAVADIITDKPVWEDGWADFVEKHILEKI